MHSSESFQPKSEVISVSELNALARALLESYIPYVWINGEISNWMLATSGHAYFLLKDERSQVRCVMFRHQLAKLTLALKNGLQVELRGQVSLYEMRGEFQINVEAIRESGLGKLFEAFNQLKNKLFQEGLFSDDKKQPLPLYSQAIGVITSATASVLRDVVSIVQVRMPNLPIILYPTAVQGIDAPYQIIRAIQAANQHNKVDVLIICRGGGSAEDLAAFNDEAVVRQVATSSIPTISGIGHETDVTLCDFAADCRAATPTAAAVLASPNRIDLFKQLNNIISNLQHAFAWQINNKSQRLDHFANRLISPWQNIMNQRDKLLSMYAQLIHLMRNQLNGYQIRLTHCRLRLQQHIPNLAPIENRIEQVYSKLHYMMQQKLHYFAGQIKEYHIRLQGLNPDLVLGKGYVIVSHVKGAPVHSPDELVHGELVNLRFQLGTVKAIIDKS
jgi:exodeoxyribonuclease VII large subunit